MGALVLLVGGAALGWVTRVRVPGRVFAALPVLGAVLLVLGISDYNDDAPQSVTFNVFVGSGIATFGATVFAVGMFLGGAARGRGDEPNLPQED